MTKFISTSVTTKKESMVYVNNPQYIKVEKSCASCQFKEILSDGSRVCTLMQLIMGHDDRCRQWQMSDGLMYAGRGFGKVKSKEYLDFVIAERSEEGYAIQEGTMQENQRASLEDIQKRYRELHGSIYINL